MKLEITCPDWLTEEIAEQRTGPPLIAPSEQMAWVLALARRNVESETGGPFAAAVFELESGKLVAAGVNRVVPAQTSIAHAETLALSLAQQYLGTHNLAEKHLPAMGLVTSAQPCIQCFGNTWWSGVQSLAISARASDIESILGFHEGPLPSNWEKLLAERPYPLPNITVTTDLLREGGQNVLSLYKEQGGLVYNANAS